MSKAEEAVNLFQHGFSCSQAVLLVFAQDFGLDRDLTLRISQGFGAEIAYTDDICGLSLVRSRSSGCDTAG